MNREEYIGHLEIAKDESEQKIIELRSALAEALKQRDYWKARAQNNEGHADNRE